MSTTRLRARVSNFVRIQRLPQDTRLRQILDDGAWSSTSRLFGKYSSDLAEVKRRQKISSVSEDELLDVLKKGNSMKVRDVLKKVTAQADIAENAHFNLRTKHPVLCNWSPSLEHPMWQRSAYEVGSHARWLTGGARISSNRYLENEQKLCEHCGIEIDSSLEEHRLLYCELLRAKDTRAEFYRTLREISAGLSQCFSKMSDQEKFAWLLTGGRHIPSRRPNANPLRVNPLQSPFVPGDSVSPINGNKDPWTNWISYDQFKEIESKYTADLQIYTDGSAPVGFAGIGVVILFARSTRSCTLCKRGNRTNI